jgi:hypothetical protein
MEREGATSAALWAQCVHLTQVLRSAAREKGFYHADVRSLRQDLRRAYEALLLHDYRAAQASNLLFGMMQ